MLKFISYLPCTQIISFVLHHILGERNYNGNVKHLRNSLCLYPAVLRADITNRVWFSPTWSLACLVTYSRHLNSSKIGPNQTVATPPRQSASASTPYRHLIKELWGLTRFFNSFQDLYNDLSLQQPCVFSANLDEIPVNTEG